MNKSRIAILASAATLALGAASAAQAMSSDEYHAGKNRIEAEYKAAKANCAPLSGNAKDICMADAKGREKVAKAELEADYKPTAKHRTDVAIAKADADYSVAKQKCDDRAGDDKKICVKEAKAAETRAKADAKANLKVSKAGKEASEDKREAEYKVAKAKCDTFSGDAKDRCITDAKARYGQ